MRALSTLPLASLLVLCVSCQTATAAQGTPAPRVQAPLPLPPAERGLELRASAVRGDAGGASLQELLAELGAATGATFTATAPTRQALEQTASGLLGDARVPAESAWTFVEALLDLNGFALSPRTDGPTHLIAVVNLRQNDGLLPRYLSVPPERLDELDEHPAVLVRTLLHLEHTDVRQSANSLRGLLGGTGYAGMVPLGDANSLLVQGPAHQVAELARFLLESEAAAKQLWERRSQQPQQQEGETRER